MTLPGACRRGLSRAGRWPSVSADLAGGVVVRGLRAVADPSGVLIADDHLLLRDGIAVLIANCDDIVVVGQAENGREAIAAHRRCGRDVTLMDLAASGHGRRRCHQRHQGRRATRAHHRAHDVFGRYQGAESPESGRPGRTRLKNHVRRDLLDTIRRVFAGHKYIDPEICRADRRALGRRGPDAARAAGPHARRGWPIEQVDRERVGDLRGHGQGPREQYPREAERERSDACSNPGDSARSHPDLTPDSAAVGSALVAGGTGLVGGHLLRLLGEDARYHRVTSLVRRQTTAPRGVDSQVVDFEQLEEFAPPPVSDAFCCLGTTRRAAGSAAAFRRVDFDYIVAFARLAMRAGALRFMLVSSLGASRRSPFLYPTHQGRV